MVTMTGRFLRQVLTVAIFGCGIAANAYSQTLPGDGAGFLPAQQDAVTLEQAIAIALERLDGGRVVRAETVMLNGLPVHEILIIRDDGLVRTVHVDPASGRVL